MTATPVPLSRRRLAAVGTLAAVVAGSAGLVAANFASGPASHSAPAYGAPALTPGPKAVAPPAGVRVGVGESLQAAVSANPAGTTFVLAAGVHRNDFDIRPKNGDRFFGEAGAVLNGSVALTAWTASGSHWVIGGQPTSVGRAGQCLAANPLCSYPDDVFYDAAPLKRVATVGEVAAGTYFYDYAAGQIHLGSTPSGHVVELAVAGRAAFLADLGAGGQGVELANLVIEKYGVAAQLCAVSSLDAGGGYRNTSDPNNGLTGGWSIHDNELRLNHGCGVYAGPGTHLVDNAAHDNGQLGLKAWGRRVELRRNDVAHNNIAGFDTFWEAGGVKVWNSASMTIADNVVRDNVGPGIWSDYGLTDIVYDHNTITNNRNAGIAQEMTISGKASFNYIAGNDWVNKGNPGYTAGGIFVFDSSNFEVTGNVLDNNNGGVVVLAQERGCVGPNISAEVGSCPAGSTHATVDNVWVHDNDIGMVDGFTGLQIVASADYTPYAVQTVAWAQHIFQGGIVRFDSNRYHGTGYESTRRGTNGTQFDDPNNRFMWSFPTGWGSDPNNIWNWADRRFMGYDDFRANSGQEGHATLNGSAVVPPTTLPPATTAPPTTAPATTAPATTAPVTTVPATTAPPAPTTTLPASAPTPTTVASPPTTVGKPGTPARCARPSWRRARKNRQSCSTLRHPNA